MLDVDGKKVYYDFCIHAYSALNRTLSLLKKLGAMAVKQAQTLTLTSRAFQ
jgi:hypothetical protein